MKRQGNAGFAHPALMLNPETLLAPTPRLKTINQGKWGVQATDGRHVAAAHAQGEPFSEPVGRHSPSLVVIIFLLIPGSRVRVHTIQIVHV
jgi:hypothetical protein